MDTKLFVRHQPGGFFAVTDRELTPSGSVFWVHAGTGTDGAGYGRNPDAPVATLDYAIGLCTASKGDVIYLMPGHAENIASATGCVLDIAGVKVIGLGNGTLRPTLTMTTAATSKISITAANCWIENVLVVSNFLNIAAAIRSDAGRRPTLKNVEMRNTSVILGALIQISIAAACTDLTIDGFKFLEVAAAGLTAPATNVILCAGAADRFTFDQQPHLLLLDGGAGGVVRGGLGGCDVENMRLLNNETGAGLGIAATTPRPGSSRTCRRQSVQHGQGGDGHGAGGGRTCDYSNAVNAYAGLYSYTVDS